MPYAVVINGAVALITSEPVLTLEPPAGLPVEVGWTWDGSRFRAVSPGPRWAWGLLQSGVRVSYLTIDTLGSLPAGVDYSVANNRIAAVFLDGVEQPVNDGDTLYRVAPDLLDEELAAVGLQRGKIYYAGGPLP